MDTDGNASAQTGQRPNQTQRWPRRPGQTGDAGGADCGPRRQPCRNTPLNNHNNDYDLDDA
eukprot:3220918-Lingulodinium_polyedra.AAC.1